MDLTPVDAAPVTSVAAEPRARLIEVDVVRAVALIGVCVMNYHGYLIFQGGSGYPPRNFAERVFDPWEGPLSTRFAATFVALAGIGITLLTRRSRASGDREAISAMRRTLVRRGVLLYLLGYFLDWVWSGTIIVYYGAFFVVGAVLFTLRSRWLMAIGTAAALAAAAIQWWALERTTNGHDTTWLLTGSAADDQSPRELIIDLAVRGTHPLLPWLLFLCLGLVLGRMLPFSTNRRIELGALGAICLGMGYMLREALALHPTLESTTPFDRGLLYSLTTVGSTLLAIVLIGAAAQATSRSFITRALGVAGRNTLTLYVGHVLVFNLLVTDVEWVRPGGLGTALLLALGYWVCAVALAVLWNSRVGIGPLEWVYRRFSDAR